MMGQSDQSFQQQYSPQGQQQQQPYSYSPQQQQQQRTPEATTATAGYPQQHAPPVTSMREQERKQRTAQFEPGFSFNELRGLPYCCLFPTGFLCTALLVWLIVFLVFELVFAIMGLAQSRDVRNNEFQAECASSMTNFFIVFGSFVIFLLFFTLCCTPRLAQVFQGPTTTTVGNDLTSNMPTGIFGTGFVFLVRFFLFVWVLYGFSTQLSHGDEYSSCNLGFFQFFQLVTNFMFWSYMSFLITLTVLSLFVCCAYQSMDQQQKIGLKQKFGMARPEGAAADAIASRQKMEARRQAVNNPAAGLTRV